MIEITSEQVDRIHLLLGGIKDAPQKAIYNVLNRAVSTVKTTSSKEVRKTYKIKHSDLTSNQNIKTAKAGPSKLEAAISFGGNLIPLMKFNVNPKQPQKKTVSASVLSSGGKTRLIHAYVANLGKYGVGVFERETSERDSSKQLYGPSAAHLVENKEVLNSIQTAAMNTIDKRIEHEISRILNGYT
ncbi:MAG: phage tail protein [Eubacterium sp.]|nr:phage tail protein [Eubacterium sp.]